ncbi:expressed unknown protein (Partial), partial [Seminavis robusta]|eukprot:Sro1987_g309610.1 n/a (172) ;mRNA; f:19317-19834
MVLSTTILKALEEMCRYGSAFFTPTGLVLCFLVATITTATAFSARSSTSATNVKGLTTTTSTASNETTPLIVPNKEISTTKKSFSLFCKPSTFAPAQGREPSFLKKQLRRFTVFRVAFQVFLEYKWAQRQAKRRKKRLQLDPDDPDSDDHPEIQAYWSQVHDRNAKMLLKKI